jgi:hypothetical protein
VPAVAPALAREVLPGPSGAQRRLDGRGASRSVGGSPAAERGQESHGADLGAFFPIVSIFSIVFIDVVGIFGVMSSAPPPSRGS